MEELSIAIAPTEAVSAILERPPAARALLVLAHGAGAGMRHRFMNELAAALGERGVATLRYHFPYMEAGRRRPDRPALLEATVRAAVAEAARRAGDLALFAGGKSMGGRMASQAAANGLRVDGLIFLGYPLHPPGRFEKLRDAHLPKITAPMLFVQGTRDDFARSDLLEATRATLGDRATLVKIEDGDHSFAVRKKLTGQTSADVERAIGQSVVDWLTLRGL